MKPSMPETTALGAAMAAGAAEGVSVWSLSPEDLSEVTSEKFEPQINCEGTTGTMSCPVWSLLGDTVTREVHSASVFPQRASVATLAGRRPCRSR